MTDKPTMLYYVHHHGTGHERLFMRLSERLEAYFNVVAVVNNEALHDRLITSGKTSRLLSSKWTPGTTIAPRTFDAAFEGIPYTAGPAKRLKDLSDVIIESQPAFMYIDGSAELAIAARSMGVPVVMNRLLGRVEQDPTQVFAYECADLVTAFFPEALEDESYPFADKTHYYGFKSRYTGQPSDSSEDTTITILSGSEPFDNATVTEMIEPSGYTYTFVGSQTYDVVPDAQNITIVGFSEDLSRDIPGSIVVSAAGLNSISDLAAMRKKMILLPAERPYDEQVANAARSVAAGIAFVKGDESWENFYKNVLTSTTKNIGASDDFEDVALTMKGSYA